MSSNCPGTPTTKKPNILQNKNTTKSIPPPLVITKPLNNQTGDNNPLDFSDNFCDWKTVVQNPTKRIRSPNNISPSTKKPDTNIFITANRFDPIAHINEDQPMETIETENNENKTSKPLPIFIQEKIIYSTFCQKN